MVLGGRDRKLNVLVNVKGIDKANAQLKQTEGIGNKAAGGIGKSFQSIGPIITALGPLIAGAFSVGVITNFIKEVSAIGVAVAETRSLIAASFDDMQGEIEEWSETSIAALTRTKLEVQETAAVFFNIFQGMKVNREEAFKLSTAYVDLISDIASFNRALFTQEEILEKVRAASTGEFEGLKALGIVLNEQIIKEQAYADGLAEVGEQLDLATKAQVVFNAIQERAGAAIGDTERTLDSAAGQIAVVAKETKELKEEIGERMIPATQAWTKEKLRLVTLLSGDFKRFMELSIEQVGDLGDAFVDANPAVIATRAAIEQFGDSAVTEMDRVALSVNDAASAFFGLAISIQTARQAGTETGFPAGGAEPTPAQINAITTQATLGGLFPAGKFKLGTGLGFQIAADKARPRGVGVAAPKGTDADPVFIAVSSRAPEIAARRAGQIGAALGRGGFVPRSDIIKLLGLDDAAFRQEIQDIQISGAFAGAQTERRRAISILGFRQERNEIAGKDAFAGAFAARRAFLDAGDETDTAAEQRRQQIQSVVLAAAAAGLTGGGPGAGAALLTGGLGLAGFAIGGPFGGQVGATVGGLLSGLLFRRRQRPQLTEPIPVTIVNPDDIATSFLKATQQAFARGAGGGIDRLEGLRQAQIATGVVA